MGCLIGNGRVRAVQGAKARAGPPPAKPTQVSALALDHFRKHQRITRAIRRISQLAPFIGRERCAAKVHRDPTADNTRRLVGTRVAKINNIIMRRDTADRALGVSLGHVKTL